MTAKLSVLEQTFQQNFRTAVTAARPKLPLRLWRQPSGTVLAKRGGAVECAPVGAADLSGIVAPEGWRLEIEMKAATTAESEEQGPWAKFIRESGGIAFQLRYDESLSMEENLERSILALRAAIVLHRLRTCVHPDEDLVQHAAGGVMCTRCGWRNGGRPAEAVRDG
ncbi:MAG: hypothetical protein Q8S73_36815 [Deltaproteobacteria bacterium]|nr:hypothetical protein [Myxococcales bacterium]MDP3219722.1 hypothetical protein [Deltaproteobacteria bacterium]